MVGNIVGTGVAAYGSTMGPRSGLRQMVGARFQYGWFPAKIVALLNILTFVGMVCCQLCVWRTNFDFTFQR